MRHKLHQQVDVGLVLLYPKHVNDKRVLKLAHIAKFTSKMHLLPSFQNFLLRNDLNSTYTAILSRPSCIIYFCFQMLHLILYARVVCYLGKPYYTESPYSCLRCNLP
jgi:hypothetical protein